MVNVVLVYHSTSHFYCDVMAADAVPCGWGPVAVTHGCCVPSYTTAKERANADVFLRNEGGDVVTAAVWRQSGVIQQCASVCVVHSAANLLRRAGWSRQRDPSVSTTAVQHALQPLLCSYGESQSLLAIHE